MFMNDCMVNAAGKSPYDRSARVPPVATIIDTVRTWRNAVGFVFSPAKSTEHEGGVGNTDHLAFEFTENISGSGGVPWSPARDERRVGSTRRSSCPQRRSGGASCHVEVFKDPLVESVINQKRYRADISSRLPRPSTPPTAQTACRNARDPAGNGEPGQWTEPANVNMMPQDPPRSDRRPRRGVHYLRPETHRASS